ncbi:MAG TPA: ABC transporter permease [Anaerolineaceae bacterium]|nr:ABC transporter permease [Anaerolineaceae bacterium]
MRNIWTIAKREYKLYFISPIAWVVAFIIFLVLGYFFYSYILYAANQQLTGNGSGYVPDMQSILSPLITIMLFASPAFTMRTLADEQRMGTMEVMLTAPVRDWELVVGKWLGAFLFYITILALTWIYPLVMNQMVKPGIDQGLLLSQYLGLFLLFGAFAAIGVMVSSFFSNQIAAFFTTLGVLLILWLLSFPVQASGGVGGDLLSYLDMQGHLYNTFMQGIVELKDVIYYISITILALFIGSMSVETRRWR